MAKVAAGQSKPRAGKGSGGARHLSFENFLKSIVDASKQYILLLGLIAGVPAAIALIAYRYHVSLPIAAVGFGALPFLLILGWYVAIRREARNKARAIELGIHGQIKHPDYFRLTPYDAESYFQRADNIHEKVYAWITGSRAPLLYLLGASGSGKSSIISGWVLPKFARERMPVLVVTARVVGDPMAAVRQAVLSPRIIWERPTTVNELGLRELLEKAAKKVAPRKLLLVLDQFEEFLILARGEQRDAFIAVLTSLATSAVPNLQLLMILREDYRGQLESLALPVQERDMMTVPKFYESDAIAFLKASELEISDTLEEEIFEEAREVEQAKGLIRPITINLFGLVLRRFHTLPKNYRRGTLLRSYLRELIERTEIRDFAAPILRCMINGNSKRPAVAYTDIASELRLDPLQVRGCLVQLANEGVVRELNGEHGIWEISHDFIASLYRPVVEIWRLSFLRRYRPWIIFGVAGIWLVSTVMLWTSFNEGRQRAALLSLGFSNVPCPNPALEPQCQAWAAQIGVDDAALVKAVSHFRDLGAITSINLSHTKITNIAPLRDLPGLKMLDVSMTQISDITPLGVVPKLESINLWNDAGITDFSVLANLTDLRELDLRDTQFQNIDVLGPLKYLESLKLNSDELPTMPTENFSLNSLKNLKLLDLNSTGVKDIDGFKDLHNLQALYLGKR